MTQDKSIALAHDIVGLAPDKRFRAILDSDDPAALVNALPPQEFWVTIKEVGAQDAMELLELANDEQLLFIQDVECWVGDKLDREKTIGWLGRLASLGPDKVTQWLRSVDPETFITVLRLFMLVTKPDEGTDPHQFADTMPPYTIDNVYYLHFFSDNEREILVPILLLFSNLRFDLYARMMEAMIWESGPEAEEYAQRWRRGRLSDYGIPDFDEASAIYQYMDEKTFWALGKKEAPGPVAAGYTAPKFPIALPGKRTLLADALDVIPAGEILDGIMAEIVSLANRVVVADALDVGNPAHLKQAVSKVRSILSMGLEKLAAKNIEAASGLLKTKWVAHIFQVGYAQTLDLTRWALRLQKTGWMANSPKLKGLLGHPLAEIISGLSRSRPLWYIGGPEPYRFFDSLDEVRAAAEAMERAEYLGELFFDRLGLIEPDPKEWSWKRIYPVEINFETILRTALANAGAGKGFKFRPLEKKDLTNFIKNAFKRVDSKGKKGAALKRRFNKNVEKDLVAYLASKDTAKNAKERQIRDELVRNAIKFLEDELGRLDPENIEPKYIQGLVIKK